MPDQVISDILSRGDACGNEDLFGLGSGNVHHLAHERGPHTFCTISAFFGLTRGVINRDRYTILVTVVILSAFVPTLLAQQFFKPNVQAHLDARRESQGGHHEAKSSRMWVSGHGCGPTFFGRGGGCEGRYGSVKT